MRVANWVLALVLVSGCAEGDSLEDGGGAPFGGGSSSSGPASGGSSAESTTSSSTTAATTGTGAGPEGGSSAGGGGAGGDASGGSSTGGAPVGGGSPGPNCDFTAPEDCAGSEILPAISGDTGSDSVTRTGIGGKWFKVHVEENDSGIFGADLRYRVKLTSPPGMDYDVVVRQGPDGGSPDCNAGTTTGTGTPETVNGSIGDSQGFGGIDNSTWVIVEVRWVSGDQCDNADTWTLVVEGNT